MIKACPYQYRWYPDIAKNYEGGILMAAPFHQIIITCLVVVFSIIENRSQQQDP